MAETTTLLRDLLIVRRGAVQMDDIRKSLRGAGEAAEWLVEIGVAVWHDGKRALQALDGMGRPLEKGFRREASVPQEVRTPGVDKGPRGTVTTPVMSSRASAGGSAPHRNGWVTAGQIPLLSQGNIRYQENRTAKRAAVMPKILEYVRDGKPLKEAFNLVGMKNWTHIRDHKPEEWKLIEEAMEHAKKERERVAKEFQHKLWTLLVALGSATIDQIYKHTQGWENSKQYSKNVVGVTLRAMRALSLVDFERTGNHENRWRAT